MKNKQKHFIYNLIIAFAVSATLANIFGLVTMEEILSMEVFGSLAIIGTWVAFPVALIFDKFDFSNPLLRYYIRGK